MKRVLGLALLFPLLVMPLLVLANGSNERISGFTAKDTAGQPVSLADFKDKNAVVVLFVGTECPLVNLYMPRLKGLHDEFASKGVQFLAVNSNVQDAAERIAEQAKQHKLTFPILVDPEQRVADLFKAERTPEAFILDREGKVVYRGRIDDQFGIGYQKPKPTRRDLADALLEVIAGKPVSTARTEVTGCYIGRVRSSSRERSSEITYTKHVAGILQNKCQECHRPDQIGPVSLMTYEKARAWSATLREVVSDGRMPPWHADPRYGKFSNNRSLSDEEKKTLLAWIEAGCPKGDDKDLPPPRAFRGKDGWVIGTPDHVVAMNQEYTVPADTPKGGIPYQHFLVPTNFKEDRWIQACEARPGNRAVVHHILVRIIEPGKDLREDGEDLIGNGHLVGTAPGDMPAIYPPGKAKKIPAGAFLMFQMHYTPNGVEQTDISSVGLIFAKEPPTHEVRTRTVVNSRFRIPPGDPNHKVVSQRGERFDRDIVILSFMPHMHLRGKSFEYKAVYPDGKEEILLSVPKYDFNWQSTYRLVEPKPLPAGSRVVCTAHFDNSAGNPNNPDPTETVRWGDQTWQEMSIGWVDYYYVDGKPNTDQR